MHAPGPFPCLTTGRLYLRELTAGDADRLLEIHSDADAMRWFGSDPLKTREDALAMVETFAAWYRMSPFGIRWGIERSSDRQLLGSCGLFKWNTRWHSCSIGYELARDGQGQGYMGEALTTALDWGFEHMKLNRVEALIHPNNRSSIRLVEKLGFEREGRLRKAGFWNGSFEDILVYSLLRQDFRPATDRKAPERHILEPGHSVDPELPQSSGAS